MKEGELTVTWKVEATDRAEVHFDGHEELPDRIKAMIADSMVRQLAYDGKLHVHVDTP